MANKLAIATNFAMPLDAVTQTFGIVAKRGSGKTYTAKVLVEEMLHASAHVAVLDPIGVWWGLRTAADGKSAGISILVLGGEHGDLPLESTAGTLMADLVMAGHSIVLDLSLMNKSEQRRFSTDFLDRLYHANRAAMHLVLEEADMFAPQRPIKGAEKLLGATEDIVRRGRSRGIGVTMITQRPAVIHKDVLTQVETLIALRLPAPQDRKAIDAWVEHHGDQELRRELMSALPGLPIGEAIIWSPGWLECFQRIKVRKLRTFDSSATPKSGSPESRTRAVAQVDIEALRGQMAATVEKAEANDPTKLHARIRDLESKLKKSQEKEPETKIVEVSVFTNEDRECIDGMAEVLSECRSDFTATQVLLEAAAKQLDEIKARTSCAPQYRNGAAGNNQLFGTGTPTLNRDKEKARNAEYRQRLVTVSPQVGADLNGPESRILNALAWLSDTTGKREQQETAVAFLAKYKVGGGAFNNPKARLRAKGLIEYGAGKTLILTDAGDSSAQHEPVAATPEDIQERVYSVIDGPMIRILRPLIDAYPSSMSNLTLAEMAEYAPNGGAYNNPRGRLKSCGLIEYVNGGVKAAPFLFLE